MRLGMVGAWIAGFALYQWLHPGRPVVVDGRIGEPPDYGIGATVPSFAVSFALALAIAALGKRRF